MSDSESYMEGWRKGYHNATLAERQRIIRVLEEVKNKWRKTPTFHYPSELNRLITLIKETGNE